MKSDTCFWSEIRKKDSFFVDVGRKLLHGVRKEDRISGIFRKKEKQVYVRTIKKRNSALLVLEWRDGR